MFPVRSKDAENPFSWLMGTKYPDMSNPDKDQKEVEPAQKAEGLGELQVNLAVGHVKMGGFSIKEAFWLQRCERLESLAEVFELEDNAFPTSNDWDERGMLKNDVWVDGLIWTND